jgi:hypothetical protein
MILTLWLAACSPAAGPVVLNEVLFHPSGGASQFVEIKNAGVADVNLAGYRLTNEKGDIYTLPSDLPPVPAAGLLLVLFDGRDDLEQLTLHANLTDFLDPNSGYVQWGAPDGTALDQVAWGIGQLYPVRLSPGGRVLPIAPGTTIGRFPSSIAQDPSEWAAFAPDQASPGGANPYPGVQALTPLNGAMVTGPAIALNWYPVAGAAQYRVQVAADANFTAPTVDQTVAVPPLNLDQLHPGDYYWRVQALAADGSAADFSAASLVTALSPPAAAAVTAQATGTTLPVPMIFQHKDTAMLMLELNSETGAHAWDVDHQTLNTSDPADNMNCGLASTAMVNAYYGGQLSQDRIGYEVFKDRRPGPEQDLNYGFGLNDAQQTQALKFALGAAPSVHAQPYKLADFWKDLTSEIDAGRPVVATTPVHVFVVTGYSTANGKQAITINDPWTGTYQVDTAAPQSSGLNNRFDTYFLLPASVNAASDEPEIHQDSDGDGVVDFDEAQRFNTNASDPDTDQDGVKDKDDIRASVFDTKHGYALGHQEGRDFDGDGSPMELDPDSDGGGCFDSLEDLNANGKYEPSAQETYNFDPKDDACVSGTDTLVIVDDEPGPPDAVHQIATLIATFSLKAKEAGKLEGLAQGRYTADGQATGDLCILSYSVGPLVWGATLAGAYFGAGAGQTFLSFQATPDRGPAYVFQWVGNCPSDPTTMDGPTWSGQSGMLVNGVYDFHFISPGPSGTAEETVHIEQSTGAH